MPVLLDIAIFTLLEAVDRWGVVVGLRTISWLSSSKRAILFSLVYIQIYSTVSAEIHVRAYAHLTEKAHLWDDLHRLLVLLAFASCGEAEKGLSNGSCYPVVNLAGNERCVWRMWLHLASAPLQPRVIFCSAYWALAAALCSWTRWCEIVARMQRGQKESGKEKDGRTKGLSGVSKASPSQIADWVVASP
jgi:hypothetical protein